MVADFGVVIRAAREFAIDFGEYAYTSKLTKEQFTNSQYYGDLVHQIYYPTANAGKIPEPFKVNLPTKEIAEKWKGMQYIGFSIMDF